MTRTTQILVIILLVAVIGGGAFLWLNRDTLELPWSTTNSTNTNGDTNQPVNQSTTPTNLSTPQDLSGDTPLTGTVKVGTTDVKFTSLDRLGNFDQTAAPEGQQYVVLYFEGLDGSATAAVFTAFSSAQLVDGGKRYSPDKLKVASNVVQNDRGYIVFLAPLNAGALVVEVGSGADVQRVELP